MVPKTFTLKAELDVAYLSVTWQQNANKLIRLMYLSEGCAEHHTKKWKSRVHVHEYDGLNFCETVSDTAE